MPKVSLVGMKTLSHIQFTMEINKFKLQNMYNSMWLLLNALRCYAVEFFYPALKASGLVKQSLELVKRIAWNLLRGKRRFRSATCLVGMNASFYIQISMRINELKP